MILAVVALLWLQLFWAQVPVWMHGEYYSYGWFVPPLAAAFAWRRFGMQPVGTTVPTGSEGIPGHLVAVVFVGMALLPLLRIVELADPGWRIPLIVHAGTVGFISHLLVASVKGWKFSISLLPVTVFALTAIPYPGGFENALIRKLTGSVIALTSEVFLLAGRPVEVLGERLTMGSEVVAVTDGCSGIRSLQSLIMASLFFGELLLLPLWKRAALVAVGGACAIFVNTGRAWWLAVTQFDHGPHVAAGIHDTVGHVAFLLSAGILYGTAWLLQSRRTRGRVVLRRVGPVTREEGSSIP